MIFSMIATFSNANISLTYKLLISWIKFAASVLYKYISSVCNFFS